MNTLTNCCPMVYSEEATALTGKPPKSLVKLAARGKFPKPVKIGRQNAWPRQKLLQFLGLLDAPQSVGVA